MTQESSAIFELAREAATSGDDYTTARRLYAEAAQKGEIEAIYYLSLMYRDGKGGPRDPEHAKRLFNDYIHLLREAANNGDPASQRRLGQMLQYGDGILKNEIEAIRWITKAAEQGLPEAQFHLSRLYAFGWCGLQQNSTAADIWLDRAVDSDYPEALYTKGVDEANDFLVSRERSALRRARSWLERAAKLGYGDANTALLQLSQSDISQGQ